VDILFLLIALVVVVRVFNAAAQRRRIALLAQHLSPLRIEPLMGTLMDGYLRALGETDAERQRQVWAVLDTAEAEIDTQLARLAASVARMPAEQARVSRLPIALPGVEQMLPQLCLDVRELLAIHARGVAALRQRSELPARERAYTLSAELLLFQHSCHWFCKSKMVASARLLARHKTSHAQVLASVSAGTREAYLALVSGR
jgi:hypothetical protein